MAGRPLRASPPRKEAEMADEDQNRGSGVAESDLSTPHDAGSKERDNGGRPVADAVNTAAGEAKAGLEKAAEAPSMDFKAVLRDARRTVADEVKAAILQAAAETVAPAARKATTSVLVYVMTKGPGLVENAVKTTIAPRLKQAGGGARRGRVEDAEVGTEQGEQPPAEGERQPAEAEAKVPKAEAKAPEAEGQAAEDQEREEPEAPEREEPEAPEREEPEARSSAQWQVRRRAPGRPSRPRR